MSRRRASGAMALLPSPAPDRRLAPAVLEVIDLAELEASGYAVARLDDLPPLQVDTERVEQLRRRVAARTVKRAPSLRTRS